MNSTHRIIYGLLVPPELQCWKKCSSWKLWKKTWRWPFTWSYAYQNQYLHQSQGDYITWSLTLNQEKPFLLISIRTGLNIIISSISWLVHVYINYRLQSEVGQTHRNLYFIKTQNVPFYLVEGTDCIKIT